MIGDFLFVSYLFLILLSYTIVALIIAKIIDTKLNIFIKNIKIIAKKRVKRIQVAFENYFFGIN